MSEVSLIGKFIDAAKPENHGSKGVTCNIRVNVLSDYADENGNIAEDIYDICCIGEQNIKDIKEFVYGDRIYIHGRLTPYGIRKYDGTYINALIIEATSVIKIK